MKEVRALKEEELRVTKSKKSAQEDLIIAQGDCKKLQSQIAMLSKLEATLKARKP